MWTGVLLVSLGVGVYNFVSTVLFASYLYQSSVFNEIHPFIQKRKTHTHTHTHTHTEIRKVDLSIVLKEDLHPRLNHIHNSNNQTLVPHSCGRLCISQDHTACDFLNRQSPFFTSFLFTLKGDELSLTTKLPLSDFTNLYIV